MYQYFLVPGPGGELLEELRERPQAVTVRLLDSSTAAVSWAPSSENHNGSLVSVVSTTCLRPSLSQRMENTYCSEVTSYNKQQNIETSILLNKSSSAVLNLFSALNESVWETFRV